MSREEDPGRHSTKTVVQAVWPSAKLTESVAAITEHKQPNSKADDGKTARHRLSGRSESPNE